MQNHLFLVGISRRKEVKSVIVCFARHLCSCIYRKKAVFFPNGIPWSEKGCKRFEIVYFEITCHVFLSLADAINSLLVLYCSCCHRLRCMAKPEAGFFSLIHHNSEIFPSVSARCLYTRDNLWTILDALSFFRCCSGFHVYWGRF